MKKLMLVFLFTLSGLLSAAEMSSPATYDKDNLSFSYPNDWKVTEDAEEDNVRYLFVENSGDSILIAQIYAKDEAVSLKEYAEWFSSQTQQEVSMGSFSESSYSDIELTAVTPARKGLLEEFSVSLLGMEVPHIRKYFTLESADKVAFLVVQSATEDLSGVEVGFDLILKTFSVE